MFSLNKAQKLKIDEDNLKAEAAREEWLQTDAGKEYTAYVESESQSRKEKVYVEGSDGNGFFFGGDSGLGGASGGDCGGGDGGGSD